MSNITQYDLPNKTIKYLAKVHCYFLTNSLQSLKFSFVCCERVRINFSFTKLYDTFQLVVWSNYWHNLSYEIAQSCYRMFA